MARTLADCAIALAALTGRSTAEGSLQGARIAPSPRLALVDSDPDVVEGFERAVEACRALGAELVEPPPPGGLDLGSDFLDVLSTDMLGHHRRFETDRRCCAPHPRAARVRRAAGDDRPEYGDTQLRRTELTAEWIDWLAEHRLDAVIEPTVPIVAPVRGHGYDAFFTDEAIDYIRFTHYWDWTGFPVAALPSGVGSASGLPVGVSLIGAPGAEWRLLALGIELQEALGVPRPR